MKVQQRTQRGFTLIELMIVVAIIGIIAAIAYPSYNEYVNKSRRADAMSALSLFAGAMERHFTVNSTYCGTTTDPMDTADCTIGAPEMFSSTAPLDGGDVFYNLEITSLAATSFELTAEPANAQAGDTCGDLILQHTGARSTSPVNNSCWP
ncbi:MAG: type IV pilin protein [Motiliproteus sp.]